MSKLLEFLVQHPVDNLTDEVVVSGRLQEFPFTIKVMSGTQFAEYQKASTVIGKKQSVSFDSQRFNEMVVINHTVEPNFRDAESIKSAGCRTPEQFLYRSLLAGEISELSSKISALSGFDADIEEVREEAKNSSGKETEKLGTPITP